MNLIKIYIYEIKRIENIEYEIYMSANNKEEYFNQACFNNCNI